MGTRYYKPTGVSQAAFTQRMRGQGRLAPFVPPRLKRQNAMAWNRAELKGIDTTIGTNVDSTTEVITNTCNLITQGDSFNNREGATVLLKSIEITGRANLVAGASANATGCMYLWVVLDKQPNGAALTATGATGYLTTATANEALPTIPMQYRFKTLGKIRLDFSATAGVTTAYNNQSQSFTWFKKFKKPIEVRFTANAGAITDIATNNIALVAGASDVDDLISLGGTVRVRFTDP